MCVIRVCVHSYVSVATLFTSDVRSSSSRQVSTSLVPSSRETLIAGEWTSVQICVASVSHTHGEGDFSTYIINNRTTRRHDTTLGWTVRRRPRDAQRLYEPCVLACWWCAIRFKHYGSFLFVKFRGGGRGTLSVVRGGDRRIYVCIIFIYSLGLLSLAAGRSRIARWTLGTVGATISSALVLKDHSTSGRVHPGASRLNGTSEMAYCFFFFFFSSFSLVIYGTFWESRR